MIKPVKGGYVVVSEKTGRKLSKILPKLPKYTIEIVRIGFQPFWKISCKGNKKIGIYPISRAVLFEFEPLEALAKYHYYKKSKEK